MELAPTQQEKPAAIRARAGFSAFKTVGSSPLRGLVARTGLFGDAAVVVMGTGAYLLDASGSVTTIAGTILGAALVEIDAGQDADLNSVARVATGSALYKITTTGVTLEDFPAGGGAGASSVCYHRGFWLASEAGTDQVFYQVPGDTTWDALSFASAEYAPDPIVAIRKLGEQIWLFGAATTEVFALTGSASPAIAPYGGLDFNFGCRAQSAVVTLPSALIWVDDGCEVRLTQGGAPTVISDPGLSEQIRKVSAGDLRASWYQTDGHTLYQLTLGSDSTWIYDLTSHTWARVSAQGFGYSRINLFASMGGVVLAGNGVTNQIYKLDPDLRTDAGTAFPVEFTGFVEISEGSVPCANVELICDTGDAPWSGAGSNPVIEMRYSDDGGKAWSRWRERPLGKAGQSRTRVRWLGLGTIYAPYGRIFHFRVSDPVGRRFSDLRMNAA